MTSSQRGLQQNQSPVTDLFHISPSRDDTSLPTSRVDRQRNHNKGSRVPNGDESDWMAWQPAVEAADWRPPPDDSQTDAEDEAFSQR